MGLENKTVCLYVGPHKSGTFYLRDQVFPHAAGIYDVRTRDASVIDLLLDAMDENPLFLELDDLRTRLHDRLGNVAENVIVISHPDFFGTYQRMTTFGQYDAEQFSDNARKTEILAAVFPDAKIILSPRRQDTWIESYYRGVLKSAQTVRISEFIAPVGGPEQTRASRTQKPACNIATLDWGVYVRNYHTVFGRENVLAVPCEMLLQDTHKAIERLFGFLGVEPYFPPEFRQVNRGYSALSCAIARRMNRFVRTPQNRLGFIPNRPFFAYLLARRERSAWFRLLAGISRRLSLQWFLTEVIDRFFYSAGDLLGPEARRGVIDFHREHNRAYAELIGVDLEPYGYY